MQIQVRGLQAVVKRLEGVEPKLRDNLRKAVEITARHIKDDAKKNLMPIATPGVSHIKHLPYAIKYQMEGNQYYVAAKVGAKGKQARLIGVIEYGSPTSAPHPFLMPAALFNRADFLKGVRQAVKDSIK
jgi:HK97 gp10 family phage protein